MTDIPRPDRDELPPVGAMPEATVDSQTAHDTPEQTPQDVHAVLPPADIAGTNTPLGEGYTVLPLPRGAITDAGPEPAAIPEATEVARPAVDPTSVERARAAVDRFPEIAGLTDCTTYASPVRASSIAPDSVGGRLFPQEEPKQLVEVNRTLSALLCFDNVASGDYDTFTADQARNKLSPERFDRLRARTDEYAAPGIARDTVLTHIAINDVGKEDRFIAVASEIVGHSVHDHDEVLKIILHNRPEMLPSFMALPQEGKDIILDTLDAGVNFGQLLQGESSVDSLRGLAVMKERPELFKHAFMEWIYDVAGIAGHEGGRGSLVMNEKLFANAELLLEAFEETPTGVPPQQIPTAIYRAYLQKRAEIFGLPFDSNEDVFITMVACMIEDETPDAAAETAHTLQGSLGESSRAILAQKMGSLEPGNPVLYYAPKFIRTLVGILKERGDAEATRNGLIVGVSTLAQLLAIQARQRLISGEQIEQIMISRLTHLAGTTPEALTGGRVDLGDQESGALLAEMRPEHNIDLAALEQIANLAELPGHNFVSIGIGGGSDVATAEVVAQTVEAAGKHCLGTVSIRAVLDTQNSRREPINYREHLGSGVYLFGPETSMSAGRYHEDLVAASGRPTVVIMHEPDISLDAQLAIALRYLGNDTPIDTVIGVDTGGDALTPVGIKSPSSAIERGNQDLDVLAALQRVGPGIANDLLTCIVGLGVDSPPNADDMVRGAGTRLFLPTAAVAQQIVERYAALGLPNNESLTRFAKTLPAFVRALQGERGLIEISLPPEVLLSPTNPWNPFSYVDEASTGLFFTKLDDHLRVIGYQP